MILVALGSNLDGPWGTPRQTVLHALATMELNGILIERASELIETKPFGNTRQPNFVNAVARVRTAKSPDALMRCLHMLEKQAGRKRLKRWGPRTLDLDLLDYHGLVREPSSTSIKPLTLPHPGILERSFVLGPILEIAPGWKHPLTFQSAAKALRALGK